MEPSEPVGVLFRPAPRRRSRSSHSALSALLLIALLAGGLSFPRPRPAAADDPTPAAGEDGGPPPGYWLTGPDGGVYALGGATFLGSTGHIRLTLWS